MATESGMEMLSGKGQWKPEITRYRGLPSSIASSPRRQPETPGALRRL